MAADVAARRAAGEDPWPAHPLLEELQAQGARAGTVEPLPPRRPRGPVCRPVRHRWRHRSVERGLRPDRRGRWGARSRRRWSSTATHPTPATWRCCSSTAATSRSGVARAVARRPDPQRLPHDRAGGRLAPTRRTWRPRAIIDGDEVVLNGRKWWSTGVGNPDCKVGIFMGVTDPEAQRHRQPLDGRSCRSTTRA